MRERRHQRVAGRRRLRRQRLDDARRRRAAAAGMRRRRYSRRSTDTCSLRERPVCSRRPASPEPLDEQPLDEAVHVFVGAVDKRRVGAAALEDLGERRLDLRASSRGEHAGARQRPRPREAARHVVFEQTPIEAERRAELEAPPRRAPCRNVPTRASSSFAVPCDGRRFFCRRAVRGGAFARVSDRQAPDLDEADAAVWSKCRRRRRSPARGRRARTATCGRRCGSRL